MTGFCSLGRHARWQTCLDEFGRSFHPVTFPHPFVLMRHSHQGQWDTLRKHKCRSAATRVGSITLWREARHKKASKGTHGSSSLHPPLLHPRSACDLSYPKETRSPRWITLRACIPQGRGLRVPRKRSAGEACEERHDRLWC